MEPEFKTEEQVMEFFRERHGYLTVHRICELLVTHNNVQAVEIASVKEHLHNLKNGNFLLIQQEGEDIYHEKFAGTPDRVRRYFSPPIENTPEEEVFQKVSWWKRPEIIIPIIIGVVGLFIAAVSIPWWPYWLEGNSEKAEIRQPLVGPLTVNSLADAEVPNFATLDFDGDLVELKGGEYNFVSYVDSSGYETPGYVSLLSSSTTYSYSDFNNDGLADVAAIFVANNAGSGVFYFLAIFLNNSGFPEYTTAYYLGDRIHVKSLTSSENEVFVHMITQGPNEPMCCATTPLYLHLSVYGNSINLISEEWGEPETPSEEIE